MKQLTQNSIIAACLLAAFFHGVQSSWARPALNNFHDRNEFSTDVPVLPNDVVSMESTLTAIPEKAIHGIIETYVRERLASDDEAIAANRIEVHTRWQGDIVVEATGEVELKVRPLSQRPFRGPTVVRVEICVDGITERTISATVDTRLYQRVAVTTRAIRRGATFDPTSIELSERDITTLRHGYYTKIEDLNLLQVARPIGFGDVVSHRHAKRVPIVNRGDEVVLNVASRNMVLSTIGIALQDGSSGTRIRVKNPDSGKILYGLVREDGTVTLGAS